MFGASLASRAQGGTYVFDGHMNLQKTAAHGCQALNLQQNIGTGKKGSKAGAIRLKPRACVLQRSPAMLS